MQEEGCTEEEKEVEMEEKKRVFSTCGGEWGLGCSHVAQKDGGFEKDAEVGNGIVSDHLRLVTWG